MDLQVRGFNVPISDLDLDAQMILYMRGSDLPSQRMNLELHRQAAFDQCGVAVPSAPAVVQGMTRACSKLCTPARSACIPRWLATDARAAGTVCA